MSRGKPAAQFLGALGAESARRHPLKRQVVAGNLDRARRTQRPRLSQPLQSGGLQGILALTGVGTRLDERVLAVQAHMPRLVDVSAAHTTRLTRSRRQTHAHASSLTESRGLGGSQLLQQTGTGRLHLIEHDLKAALTVVVRVRDVEFVRTGGRGVELAQ